MAAADTMTSGVAGRYASALFDLAKTAGSTDSVATNLGALSGLIAESADLKQMIESPILSADDQGKAISAVLEKAGADALTSNFVKLTAKNRRLFALPAMIKAFLALVAEDKGEVTAEVTAAHPLSDEQTKDLQATIKAAVGQDVSVTTDIDPAILGGLIVKIGSKMIDASVKTRLNSMKFAMKEVG
ncbi:MAG: F0F1 ATP synthase subunit delta [Pseudomonadota bacterium]